MKLGILSHHQVSEMKKEVSQLLSSSDYFEKGFSENEWKLISDACDEFGIEYAAELSAGHSELSVFALECGYYQLALCLGLQDKYDQGRAHLFLHQQNEVAAVIENMSSKTLREAILIQKLRMDGKFSSAKGLVNESFMEGVSILSARIQGEIYLQIASVYFNLNDYQSAFSFYLKALECFEESSRKAKIVACAFNLSVTAQYLENKNEVRNWFWKTEDLLSQFHFPSLNRSALLFSLERALSENDFQLVIENGNELIKKSGLSTIQSVLAHQTVASALLESGQVLEAELLAHQTRNLIQNNKFHQYEIQQTALELNIESLILRKIRKTKIMGNEKGSNTLNIALARFHQSRLQLSKASPYIQKIEQIQGVEDLMINLDPNFSTLPKTPRAQQQLFFQLLFLKSIPHLIRFVNMAEKVSDKTNWLQILIFIAKSYLNFETNKFFALEMAEKAMNLSENSGLEKLSAIALGFSALLSEKKRPLFLQFVQDLDSENRIWLDAFLTGVFGREALLFQSAKSALDERLILDHEEMNSKMDLIIQLDSARLTFQNETLDLSSQPVLFKLLKEIANSQKIGLDKEQIVQKVWGYEYNPLVHDQMVYTNIRRLRELIPIDIFDGKYRMPNQMKWIMLGEEKTSLLHRELSERQKKIIELLKAEENQISRSDLVRKLNISERTALRELTFLLEKNLLRKSGLGRAVKYSLAERRVS